LEVVDVVPGEVEVGGDLLHEAGGGAATVAVLERREVGRGDAERGRHVLEAEAAGGPQPTQAAAEGGHLSVFPGAWTSGVRPSTGSGRGGVFLPSRLVPILSLSKDVGWRCNRLLSRCRAKPLPLSPPPTRGGGMKWVPHFS